jgi:GNAT superfamily N-acetyltransferase
VNALRDKLLGGGGGKLRRATHLDAKRVAEARATSFGTRSAPPGVVEAVAAILAEHLALGDYGCWVVESSNEVVAFGIGMIHQHLPVDHNPSGRWGYIQSMATHPSYRRKGYATAVLQALQEWFRQVDVPSAMLIATTEGEPLYRKHGFGDHRFGTSMIWFADNLSEGRNVG